MQFVYVWYTSFMRFFLFQSKPNSEESCYTSCFDFDICTRIKILIFIPWSFIDLDPQKKSENVDVVTGYLKLDLVEKRLLSSRLDVQKLEQKA